jgi:hypothetical protein
MTRLPWRLAGVVLLALCVVVYEPAADSVLQRLVLPLGMALAAWLMVQNLVAVALGAFLLAAIHGDPGASDPVTGIGYPAVAAAAGLTLLIIFVRRFRARIAATHEARWQRRRSDSDTAAGERYSGDGGAT